MRPSVRQIIRLLLVTAALSLCPACEQNVVTQRAELIKKRNAELHRKCVRRAVQEVREQFLVEPDAWYGRMPDGAVVRLESPQLAVEVLPIGKPFYTGWLGNVTVRAREWQSWPGRESIRPLEIGYRVNLRDLKTVSIEVTSGPTIRPVHREEIAAVRPGKGGTL